MIYCVSLLFLEYIYGLELNSIELPEFKEIGLVRHDIPFFSLAVKNFLLLSLWMTLRQYIHECKKIKKQNNENLNHGDQITSIDASVSFRDNNIQTKIVDFFYLLLVKYWIFLSSGTLLLMSCQNEVVAYRIGYMLMFLYFISTFQVKYLYLKEKIII